jgi:hypothetical protein
MTISKGKRSTPKRDFMQVGRAIVEQAIASKTGLKFFPRGADTAVLYAVRFVSSCAHPLPHSNTLAVSQWHQQSVKER